MTVADAYLTPEILRPRRVSRRRARLIGIRIQVRVETSDTGDQPLPNKYFPACHGLPQGKEKSRVSSHVKRSST